MTPQERAAAIIGGHYDCEDPWYSCPLSPDGCANANMGKECTCGYEDRKQNVERLIAETRRAALLEQEELFKRIDAALTDWLRCYAPEEFTDEQLAETRSRLHGGTLFYIADLRRDLKDILTRLAQEG